VGTGGVYVYAHVHGYVHGYVLVARGAWRGHGHGHVYIYVHDYGCGRVGVAGR
jgi:hypothetical protein